MAVYMIQAGGPTGPVKIGFGIDPHVRLADCQVGNHLELRMIRIFEGGCVEEGKLHRRFSDLWIRGEWHNFSRSMLDDLGLVEILFQPPATDKPLVAELDGTHASLWEEVNAFLNKTGMPPTALGLQALNDSKFFGRLRSGKNMTTATVQRVRSFIALNQAAA